MQNKDWFIVNIICIGHSVIVYYKKKIINIKFKQIYI